MKHKKFLGIPIIGIISFFLVMALAGGAVLGAWAFSQSNPGQIVIKGSGVGLFTDSACTQALSPSTTLNYGELRNSGNSTVTINLWLKATGTDAIKPTLAVTGLPAYISLFSGATQISATPTPLYTPASATFTPTVPAINSSILGAINASATAIVLTNVSATPSGDLPTPAAPWWFKFSDNGEIVRVTNFDIPTVTATCVRGQGSTTATAHSAGAAISFGSLVVVTEVPLAPGAILPVSLQLKALSDLTPYLGQTITSWQVVFVATSDY